MLNLVNINLPKLVPKQKRYIYYDALDLCEVERTVGAFINGTTLSSVLSVCRCGLVALNVGLFAATFVIIVF